MQRRAENPLPFHSSTILVGSARPSVHARVMRIRSLVLTLLVLVLAAGCRDDVTWNGTSIDPPMEAKPFQLLSSDGPVQLADYRGQFVILTFGYTHCPDVCPATMSHLAQAVNRLGDDADEVQVVLVAVDPERDSPERVDRYAAGFDESFVGVSGSPHQIADVARRYGIYYEKSDSTLSDAGYLVDHTAAVTVLDRQGRTRLIWSFGIGADEIAADLRHLIDQG